jgi:hypothetical protein
MGRIVKRKELAALLFLAIAWIGLSALAPHHGKSLSVEVRYTDQSSHGLEILPASCPSSPHYAGDCTAAVSGNGSGSGACTPTNICNGNNVINSCTGAIVQSCAWGCSGGGCASPPPPTFTSFTATLPDGSTFTSDGHLRAQPLLVRSGSSTQLYWNVSDADSCAVTGSNDDSWTSSSSGAAGTTTGAILEKTTFTLDCESIPSATPPNVTESIDVNVVPIFQEL